MPRPKKNSRKKQTPRINRPGNENEDAVEINLTWLIGRALRKMNIPMNGSVLWIDFAGKDLDGHILLDNTAFCDDIPEIIRRVDLLFAGFMFKRTSKNVTAKTVELVYSQTAPFAFKPPKVKTAS